MGESRSILAPTRDAPLELTIDTAKSNEIVVRCRPSAPHDLDGERAASRRAPKDGQRIDHTARELYSSASI